MIPISDDNPTLRTPVATYLILGAILVVWVLVQGAGFDPEALITSVCNLGMVPGEITHRAMLGAAVPMGSGPGGVVWQCVVDNEAVNTLTPLTSMFLHGSWGHILGNALFFWVFGNNVEDNMGRVRFVVFYLLCGLIAGGAQILSQPASIVPTVGASGAIAGVLGAYLVLHPRARVNMLFFFIIFIKIIPIPAWLVLIWWFAWQLIAALPQLSQIGSEVSGGVAVWAHVAGFVAGMVLVKFFEDRRLVEAHARMLGLRSEIRD